MAREILFKAKRTDNGEWVYGYLWVGACSAYITPFNVGITYYEENKRIVACAYEIDPTTICQYTGLNDKNGKKIWENDIVRCGRNIVVSWDEHFASWCLTRKGWLYKHFFGESQNPEDCEVVGNIFDNPDLLEEKHE